MSDNPYATPKTQLDVDPLDDDLLPLASRFKRLIARIIDGIVQGVLAMILYFVVPGFNLGTDFVMPELQELLAEPDTTPFDLVYTVMIGTLFTMEVLMNLLVGLLLYFALHAYLLHNYGQTIGKWVVKVKIVSSETNQVPHLLTTFGIREWGVRQNL